MPFPREWFVWKYLIQINWAYIITLFIGSAISLYLSLHGTGVDGNTIIQSNNTTGWLLDTVFKMAGILLFLVVLFFYVIAVGILGLVMILVPVSKKRRIESRIIHEKLKQ